MRSEDIEKFAIKLAYGKKCIALGIFITAKIANVISFFLITT